MLIALAVLAAFGAYVARRNAAMGSGFDQIKKGELAERVLQRLGEPSSERGGCQDALTWLDQPVTGEVCVKELRYEALILPKYWTVGFDANDRAIAKYEYVSP
jgi:hypothetical protein